VRRLAYFYVLEDADEPSSRLRRWLAKPVKSRIEVYSVYEADIDQESWTYGPGRRICGGLGRDQVMWFHSFPETRGLLMEQWDYMDEHHTLVATPSSIARLSALVLRARDQHGPEQMPEATFRRSEWAGFFTDVPPRPD
jgi:hypothetical protein